MFQDIKVIRQLGEGSFGVVQLIERGEAKSKYAMKVFKSGEVVDKREINVLRKLRHNNIVQYRDLIIHEGKDALLMEYCSGGDLSEFLKRQQNSLNEKLVWEWLAQLSDGMAYFHAREVTHRDMKPANVLLNNGEVKISDFGLASMSDKMVSMVTTGKYFHGTPLYMAPELFAAVPKFGPKSDVWGLGCIVYEMCSLKSAFKAISDIVSCEYEPIQGDYSSELKMVAEKMLLKSPDERIDTDEILKLSKNVSNNVCQIQHGQEMTNTPPTSNYEPQQCVHVTTPSWKPRLSAAEIAICRYNKLHELAQENSRSLWLVEKVCTKSRFAMKTFKCDKSEQKIMETIDFVKKIRHIRLVQMYEVINFDYEMSIVWEYCEQGNLKKFLSDRRGQLLTEDQIWTWLSQLTSAVAYLNGKNIVHRDIKPANVLLDNNSLKLGDFGVGLVVKVTTDFSRSASTLQYMAPELINANPPYSFKSDMFALGCVVYEMCALKPAFIGSLGEIVARIQENRPEPLNSAFSRDLKILVQEMMSTDSNTRPHAADILQRDVVTDNLPEMFQRRTSRQATLSRYDKLHEIGRGQLGAVWLVENVRTKAQFAMKMLQCNVDDKTITEQINLLKKIHHPHLVQMYDVIKHDLQTVVVVEYCNQGDLKKFLNRRRGELLHEQQVWVWLSELLSALAHLREMNIVHKDIKVTNVLLSNNCMKLCDFGVGLMVTTSHHSSHMKGAGSCWNPDNLQYMAPELFNPPSCYTFQSDMFALGCVVYEMCSLKPAYSGDIGQIVAQIKSDHPPSPLSDTFSEDLKNLLQKMMSKEPQARPNVTDILKMDLVKDNLPEMLQTTTS